MTTDIELALSDWFAAQSLGVSAIPATGGLLPDHAQVLLVRCLRCPHVSGPEGADGLYDGFVDLLVETPSQIDALTQADHASLVSAVQTAFRSAPRAAISAALQPARFSLAGWYFMEPSPQHTEHRWRTELRYKLALVHL